MSKFKLAVVFILLTLTLCFVTFQFVRFWMNPAQPLSGPEAQAVFYEVKKNVSPLRIAQNLEKQGIVSNARLFYWYGRLTGRNAHYKAGDYRFLTSMRPDEVMTVLTSGISYGFPLVVPEGFNMRQVADALRALRPDTNSSQRFLELCTDAEFITSLSSALNVELPRTSLEGYLFPDTYLVTRHMQEEAIIEQMVKKFKSIFTSEMKARAQELGYTPHQIITLASIIEKETGVKEERPIISSVFHNRLHKKMKLQSDPTIVYGLKNYDGNIRKRDLTTASEYNTYVIPALPIGPIANPGKAAIEAALYPAQTPYFYFVSHNDGTHQFSIDFSEHRKAVSKFQLDPRAREGKSWRDRNVKRKTQKRDRSSAYNPTH